MELTIENNNTNCNSSENEFQNSSIENNFENNQNENELTEKQKKMMKRRERKNRGRHNHGKRGTKNHFVNGENKLKIFQKQLILQKRISSISENLKQHELNYLKKKENMTKRLQFMQTNLQKIEEKIKNENLNLNQEEQEKLCHCDCHEHLDVSEKKRGLHRFGRLNSVEKMIDNMNLGNEMENENDSEKRIRTEENQTN